MDLIIIGLVLGLFIGRGLYRAESSRTDFPGVYTEGLLNHVLRPAHPRGVSAYEIWRGLPGNENKTEDEFILSLPWPAPEEKKHGD